MTGACPGLDAERALAFVADELPIEERRCVEDHVDECDSCRAVLAALIREREIVDDKASWGPGRRIGRYVVRERIGRGGMGSVFRAEDLELGRAVALKRLHAEGDTARVRLVREARAAAQLQHPNVVAVYEVGDHEGAPFIAMELVDGDTLTAWLRAAPRTSHEIVAVLAQAARGLAAAHACGLVHRDFKPDNVLVDVSGRARVVDFGLARAAADTATGAGFPAGAALSRTASGSTVAGSPAYLAPELVRGEAPGARSDQYAFGVAALEALRGQYPFAGETAAEVWDEMAEGRVREGGRKVPARLDRCVHRALAVDPADRWPDMAVVAATLERRPRRGWLAAIAVMGLLAAGYLLVRQPSEMCTGGDAKVAGVWNALTKARTRAAFSATRLPSADYVWQLIDHQLDGYGGGWSVMHREVCEATRRRGEQSEQVMDLRMSCLAQRLQELRVVTDEFSAANTQVVSKAVNIASSLSPISGCADVEALRASMPAQDAVTMARVSALRDQLARTRMQYMKLDYRDGMRGAEADLASARTTRYQPVVAEALFLLGIFQVALADTRAEGTLEQAFLAAESSGHDSVAISAASVLAKEVGGNLARGKEGSRWLGIARAILTRRPNDRGAAAVASAAADLLEADGHHDEALAEYRHEIAIRENMAERNDFVVTAHSRVSHILSEQGHEDAALEEARIAVTVAEQTLGPDNPGTGEAHFSMGIALYSRGAYAQALAEYRRALASAENVYGTRTRIVAALHADIGLVLRDQGDVQAALNEFRQALAINEQMRGPEHPSLANTHNELGQVLAMLGRYDEAMAEFRRALAIQQRAGQSEHPDTAQTFINMGIALAHQRKNDEAVEQYRHALEILTKAHAPEPDLALAHMNIGVTLVDQGKIEQGLVELRRTLDFQARALGAEHPLTLKTRSDIAEVLAMQGKREAALAELTAVLASDVKVLGPENVTTAHVMANTGRLELDLGRFGDAIDHLRRALAILDASPAAHEYIDPTRFDLAKALWSDSKRHDEAIALALRARDEYAKVPAAKGEVAKVDRWLAERGHRVP
jgi:tetratricopeptide (TPR) repeat protein